MDDVIISIGKCPDGLCHIQSKLESIDVKLSELATQLTAIDAKLTEASAEIIGKIDALQLALSEVDVPDDASALIDEIAAKATALADIVPN